MLRIPFRLIANMWRLVTTLWSWVTSQLISRSRRKQATFVTLELKPGYALGTAPAVGLQRFIQQEPELTLLELREAIKHIARDHDIAGVILKLKGAGMGYARTQDVTDWLDALRKAGKRVIIHADGAGQKEMLMMSAATDRLLTPAGRIYLFGLRFEELFALDLLDKLGIKGQFVHIGDYKTATHRFHKAGMTTPQRLMMTSLQRGLIDQFTTRHAELLDISESNLQEALDKAPLDAYEARALGFTTGESFAEHLDHWIEAEHYFAQLPETDPAHKVLERAESPRRLAQPIKEILPQPDKDVKAGKSKKKKKKKDKNGVRPPRTIELGHYMATRHTPYDWRPLIRKKPYIAVLDLTGAIVMGSEGASPLGGGVSVKADEVIPKLLQLRNDRRCAGVLLHVNSPGGSALASDLMWFEIQGLRSAKPVVCYCSDVAASGGYYLASAADQIICQKNTITGSIGVITGKVALGGALEKLHVHTEAIEQHHNSRFMSAFEPLTQDVMDNLVRDARGFYARFLERVGQARGIERERLHRFARGRVYLGDDALDRGLVDGLGGLDEAITSIYELAGLDPERVPMAFVSHRKQSLRDLARGSILNYDGPGTQANALSELFADVLEPAKIAMWLNEEPMLALMPWRITSTTTSS